MEYDLKLLVLLYKPLKEYSVYGCHTGAIRVPYNYPKALSVGIAACR